MVGFAWDCLLGWVYGLDFGLRGLWLEVKRLAKLRHEWLISIIPCAHGSSLGLLVRTLPRRQLSLAEQIELPQMLVAEHIELRSFALFFLFENKRVYAARVDSLLVHLDDKL